jgi:hypothetical protein
MGVQRKEEETVGRKSGVVGKPRHNNGESDRSDQSDGSDGADLVPEERTKSCLQ